MCRERIFPAPLILHTKFPICICTILWLDPFVCSQQMRHQLNRFRTITSLTRNIQDCRILVNNPDMPGPECRIPLDLSRFNFYQHISRSLPWLDINIWSRTGTSLFGQFTESRFFYIIMPTSLFNIRPHDIDSPIIICIQLIQHEILFATGKSLLIT